jgi:hypothetical protein
MLVFDGFDPASRGDLDAYSIRGCARALDFEPKQARELPHRLYL